MQLFTPLNNTIMVLRDESAGDVKSDGGLFIPGRAVEIANEGEVRAVPDSRPNANPPYEPSVEVGDRVVFTKYAGSEFTLNGVPYILLKETELQGKVRKVLSSTDSTPHTEEDLKDTVQKALAELEKQANA